MGWSEDEKLLVVSEDGTVRCYVDLQSDFEPFSLGHVGVFVLFGCI
jgi:vacuolar protein sorting-associated protein 16